jgi:hypothetical protein
LVNPFEKAFRPLEEDECGTPARKRGSNNVDDSTQPLKIVKRKQPSKPVDQVKLKDSSGDAGSTSTEGRSKLSLLQGLRHLAVSKVTQDSIAISEAPIVDDSIPRSTIRSIVPSLPTLEKAASTAIYFETLYWAMLKPPKSLESAHHQNYMLARERRRLALEDEMSRQGLDAAAKERARHRWTEEETWDLRQRRQRVDAKSFTKLKTIGHGA